MAHDSIPHFLAEIEPFAVFFQHIHHPQALLIVGKVTEDVVEHRFSRMSKRSVSQIMSLGNRLGQVLVQSQCPRNGACNLADFQCVSQTGAVVISHRIEKHLRFVHQTAVGFAVDDAVAVALERCADIALLLRSLPAGGVLGQHGILGQGHPFKLLCRLANIHHDHPLM